MVGDVWCFCEVEVETGDGKRKESRELLYMVG
jgi:hypothetical protein